MGAIYRIWNKRNGKSYIGQSVTPADRVWNHLTGNGSGQIAADLIKYDGTAWEWQILADESDYPGVSLNELEKRFIRQYDSVRTGYNHNKGGGVRVTLRGQVRWRGYWDNERLNRILRSERILDAIDNYRCLQIHGMTRTEYQRQQEIISQYGSLEAYEQHKEKEWLEQQQKRERLAQEAREAHKEKVAAGCIWGMILIFFLIVWISSC